MPGGGRDVDVHCHVFCSADLPIVGFVAHYIPGLSDLSRLVSRWPELVVRALLGVVTRLPNAAAPTGDAELASLRALLASPGQGSLVGFPPLPADTLDQLLAVVTDKLPFSVGADKRQIIGRYLDTLYLAAHPRGAIAATLATTYPTIGLFTPSLVDYDAWSDDRAPTPLATQILIQETIARLSIQGRVGRPDARFHPFVAFDPRRQAEGPQATPPPPPPPAPPPVAAPAPLPASPVKGPPPAPPGSVPPVPVAAAPPPATAGVAPAAARVGAAPPVAPGAAAAAGVRVVVSPAPPPPAPTPSSTALEMVRYAIEAGGFVGVKVYPPVGFAPIDNVHLRAGEPLSRKIDDALRALYGYCQAEDVAITTHASASNEYAIGLRELVAPHRWRPVLDAFPALRLNFGHFGHDYGVVGSDTAQAWIHQAASLIEQHAHVYADLANSPLVYDTKYAARVVGILRDIVKRFPKVKRRLMYGSDWWLARLDPDAARAVERFRSVLGEVFKPDELDDVMGRNALRFLGFLDDDNRPRAGKAAARLHRFYAGAPAPAWLAPG